MSCRLQVVLLLALITSPECAKSATTQAPTASTFILSSLALRSQHSPTLHIPFAWMQVRIPNGASFDTNTVLHCSGREVPYMASDRMQEAIELRDAHFFKTGPKILAVPRSNISQLSYFGVSPISDTVGAKLNSEFGTDRTLLSRLAQTQTQTMLVSLDAVNEPPTPERVGFFEGWLSECQFLSTADSATDPVSSTQEMKIRASRHMYGPGDWIGAVTHVTRRLARQAHSVAHGRHGYGTAGVRLAKRRTSDIGSSSPFHHDISESMRVTEGSTVEAFNMMMCKNDMVGSTFHHRVRKDVAEAARSWVPGFIISLLKPIGKAVVSAIFSLGDFFHYLIKGMSMALIDMIIFQMVQVVSDISVGPEIGQLTAEINQDVFFSVVPVLCYMITGQFVVRITKGSITPLLQAMSQYMRAEAFPTIATQTTHTLSSFVSEALTLKLTRGITKAVTFTLSNSLTHVVPKYYYCMYCQERNEYCGYCYGYWRSVRANQAWWKRPESDISNGAGARSIQFGGRLGNFVNN